MSRQVYHLRQEDSPRDCTAANRVYRMGVHLENQREQEIITTPLSKSKETQEFAWDEASVVL